MARQQQITLCEPRKNVNYSKHMFKFKRNFVEYIFEKLIKMSPKKTLGQFECQLEFKMQF